MKIKVFVVFFLVYFICFSCHSKKETISNYYDVLSEKIKIIDINKKNNHYNITGVNISGDTLILIAKNEKVYVKVDSFQRKQVKLELDEFYELDILELNPIGKAGDFGKVSIIVYNDTIWEGMFREKKAYRYRFFKVLGDYFQGSNENLR